MNWSEIGGDRQSPVAIVRTKFTHVAHVTCVVRPHTLAMRGTIMGLWRRILVARCCTIVRYCTYVCIRCAIVCSFFVRVCTVIVLHRMVNPFERFVSGGFLWYGRMMHALALWVCVPVGPAHSLETDWKELTHNIIIEYIVKLRYRFFSS